jgi:hypothetical protein
VKHIDEPRLETDIAYRYEYLADFMGFSEEDIATIHGAAEALAPLVPGLVDAVYDKLFSYDATKRHFVPRQHGYQGDVPASIEALEQSHEMIEFRKQHLTKYLVGLVTRPYDAKLVAYLDVVGKIHTPKAGSKDLNVPLVQMNALLGFVADGFIATILGLGLERDAEAAALRAFSKLLWIQNDFVVRHYADEPVLAAASA